MKRLGNNSTGASSAGEPAGELDLLKRIRARASRRIGGKTGVSVRMGIGDDCALLRLRSGKELAVTTDLSIEGRHFKLEWHPPESVGHRALARGLSDLAAMGAKPVAAFLSLGVPRALTIAEKSEIAWVDRFFDGLLALAELHQVPLAGGDLAESPLAMADIVLTGAVPKGQALLRSGAQAGDRVYVTGSLGGAAAELQELGRTPDDFSKVVRATENRPHLFPQPRVAQGIWLRKHGLASAAIDLSDGLSTDLNHLCEESSVAAEVYAAALPLANGASLAMALHGGEDYELLFTAPGTAKIPRRIAGVPITAIGQISRMRRGGTRVTLKRQAGSDLGSEPLEPHGWQHFRPESL